MGVQKANIAIDFGSSNIRLCMPGRGVVLQEPSLIAVNTSGGIEAVGERAKDMVGKTPDSIKVIQPVQHGTIHDFDKAVALLHHCTSRVKPKRVLELKRRTILNVPLKLTAVERQAYRDLAIQAGAKSVTLVEAVLAAGIGAGLPVFGPTGSMLVQIGGGVTEVGLLALGGIVNGTTLRVGGHDMDACLKDYLRQAFDVVVGEKTTEELKIRTSSTLENKTYDVKGRQRTNGLPRLIQINQNEILEALEPVVAQIVHGVVTVLEKTPPELCGDIYRRGLVLSGGGAYMVYIKTSLERELHLPVEVADNPSDCAILGDLELMRLNSQVTRHSKTTVFKPQLSVQG